MRSAASAQNGMDEATESYAEHRRRLIAAGLPTAILAVFTLTLLYQLAILVRHPDEFRAEIVPNAVQLGILVVAFGVARAAPRRHAELIALIADLAFTAVLAGRVLLPTTTVSGTALFLSLKMVGTALLFSWRIEWHYASIGATLGLYWGCMWLSGRPVSATHQLLGPLIAAALSAVGAARAEQTRRTSFLRRLKLAQSEARLRAMLETEQGLVAIAREISELTDLHTALERINRETAEATKCDFSTAYLLDDHHRELAATATYTGREGDRAEALTIRASIDTPLAQEVLLGRTVVINDPAHQPWLDPAMLARYRVQSLALAPIIAKGRALGVLTAGRITSATPLGEREVALLNGLAAQAAVAIENARLFDRLVASEARYRDLFERANDLIFVVDEGGAFHFANQAALDFVQVKVADVTRLTWHDLLPQESVRQITRRMAIARHRALDPSRSFEVEACRADGASATLEVRAQLVSQPGQPRLFHCIARDVTERKHQELETQRLLHRLRESSRLQAEFVANMSHELRTPLNVIIGYTDLLIDDSAFAGNREARTFLGRIAAAGRALHRLVESVLEYARLDRGRTILIPTRFTADQLLLELRALCNDVRSSPNVAVRISGTPGIEFRNDYDRLYSILSNLLLNALKFTPRGEVELTVRRFGDEAEFSVRDTGIGIAEEDLGHVFEPFRQVDGSPTRSFGGVGLGLAIVRRNVDLLGGHVAVESRVGVGSTFRVRVPLELDSDESMQDAAPTAA